MRLERFKYLVSHGYKIPSISGYNYTAVARMLNGERDLEKHFRFIPSLSFLAPENGDAYNNNFVIKKLVVPISILGYNDAEEWKGPSPTYEQAAIEKLAKLQKRPAIVENLASTFNFKSTDKPTDMDSQSPLSFIENTTFSDVLTKIA
jgi:hypothetical protein